MKDFVNATDSKGRTALHIACYKGYANLVRYLMKTVKVENLKAPNRFGRTPLELVDAEIVTGTVCESQKALFAAVKDGQTLSV